jgi:NitT/TauT family transport system substrate-binding protein
MINELVSTIFYNQDEIVVQVVRFARTASKEDPQFRILTAGNSGITSLNDLKGVEIGISEGTVIEYLVDRLLESSGFSKDEILTISVPGIPDRLALLNSGELKAAMLPDPLSSLAIQSGADVILDDTSFPEFGYSVISFRKSIIDDHPEAIRGFLAALERAVGDINADPSQWDGLLAERGLVPEVLLESYQVPQFPLKSIPSEAQFADVVNWMKDEGLVSRDYVYRDSVTGEYFP